MFSLNTHKERLKFMEEHESGIYVGKTVEGDDIRIFLDKERGMKIKTRYQSKPKWWEVVDIDGEGFGESLSYEPA